MGGLRLHGSWTCYTLSARGPAQKTGDNRREIFGIDRIKVLDEEGNEIADRSGGELYARTPMLFKEYWNLPEKTKEVFCGEWFTAGDMCYRDPEGFYVLVDRKANMIITGGEMFSHPKLKMPLRSYYGKRCSSDRSATRKMGRIGPRLYYIKGRSGTL